MKREELYAMRKRLGELEQIKDTIASVESLRVSPRAAAYGGDRVQASTKGDVQAENIQRIDELLKKYNDMLAETLLLVERFERAAARLNEQERKVLRMYFIQRRTWEEICVEIHVSWGRIMRIRHDALEALCDGGSAGSCGRSSEG